jgi:hypothetical protein
MTKFLSEFEGDLIAHKTRNLALHNQTVHAGPVSKRVVHQDRNGFPAFIGEAEEDVGSQGTLLSGKDSAV